MMTPTNRLRWTQYKNIHDSGFKTPPGMVPYEFLSQPILQQWWQNDDPPPSYGEWRDVPLEQE
jgi:hypothetical protein